MSAKLLTAEIRERLLANGRLRLEFQMSGESEPDFLPVVKLFTPDANCTWQPVTTPTSRR